MHTTNYFNAFISVSEDCPVKCGTIPPEKAGKTVALLQYECLIHHPYAYTSDDVSYFADGERKGMTREAFFSKGRACLRSSPLVKRYGWGIHANGEGKIALFAMETEAYALFQADERLRQMKGMRSCKT